jgi:hypothetical protein
MSLSHSTQALATNTLWRSITQKGILHSVLKYKYLPHITTVSWLKSTMYLPRSASNLWKNLNKSKRWIHSFLGWNPGLGHSILLGKDEIVGME